MKLFRCTMIIAIPLLLICFSSCTHRFKYTKVETTQDFPMQVNHDSLPVSKDAVTSEYPSLGKVLKTHDFDFRIYKSVLSNSKSSLPKLMKTELENGYRFLILYVSVTKNNREKIQNIKEGELWICKGSWQYKYTPVGFVKTESEGKSPLKEKDPADNSITLVYKIPKDFKGTAYFQPSTLKMDERMSLGNL